MIASNYARALFEIAQEQEKVDVISYDYDELKNIIEKEKDWVKLLDTPMISDDEKNKIIEQLGYDVSFQSFLKMLAEKRIMHFCLDIYKDWIKRVRILKKIAHIHIVSATQITEKQKSALRRMLQSRFAGQTLSFHITIDETIIGGIKIVYEGQSLDKSIVRELEELYITI